MRACYNQCVQLSELEQILSKACRLEPGQKVVVGFSCGTDSLCLLDGLACLQVPVIAAHFNHGLRPEADADAAAAVETARRLGVACISERQEVAEQARQAHLSLEEAARQARYRFLFRVARQAGAQAVAVAHTADDQVETVLMHLLRGAGLAGLCGMPVRAEQHAWDAEIALLRPLLSFWRADTEAWCAQRALTPLEDPSNRDQRFFRNRLRHDLLPYLQTYNPQVKELLVRTAASLAEDESVLQAAAVQAWQACRAPAAPGWTGLDCAGLANLPLGLQRRVVRLALDGLRGLRDIDFPAVERVLSLLDSAAGRQVNVQAGLTAFRLGERILIGSGRQPPLDFFPQLAEEACLLDAPGEVALAGGWKLTAEWVPAEQVVRSAEGLLASELQWEAWLDGGRLHFPLKVRGAQRGERFAPLGLAGRSTKLSDFFINQKVPQAARAGWPLLVSGQEIVWAAGLRLSEAASLREGTSQILHVRLRPAASRKV